MMITLKSALIIDDDAEIRKVFAAHLKDMGLFEAIEQASNGEEAFQRIELKQYDVILLDLDMPGMSGLDVIKTYVGKHQQPKQKLPFIIVSGLLNSETVQEAVTLGIKDFLAKPVTWQALTEKVKEFIAKR
jgi:YesN/AraC family two-component response regulator